MSSSIFRRGTLRRGSLRTALAALGAALLASCGGSTSQLEPFVAGRVLAFGDEASVITSEGRLYSVNGVNTTTGAIDCTLSPIWIQVVASYYGFVFEQCNTTTPPSTPRAFTRATVGAQVEDVAAQISAQVAAGGFRDKDLALFYVGVNDVLALYAQYPSRSEESLIAEARARGERAASLVNRLIDLGAKVVLVNLPDMGLSPFARAEAATHAASGFDRAALITRIGVAFNERLGVRIRIDGRFVGLAQLDLSTQQMRISPGSFGISDLSTAPCTVALPDCTTATITTGVDANTALWADSTRLGIAGQNQIATLALQRAQLNPF
jgi:outer membrane lipase/esterase